MQTAPTAGKQFQTNQFFQPRQLAADCRLRRMQQRGGFGDVSRRHDGMEYFNMAQGDGGHLAFLKIT